jgi:hypothetical protein
VLFRASKIPTACWDMIMIIRDKVANNKKMKGKAMIYVVICWFIIISSATTKANPALVGQYSIQHKTCSNLFK